MSTPKPPSATPPKPSSPSPSTPRPPASAPAPSARAVAKELEKRSRRRKLLMLLLFAALVAAVLLYGRCGAGWGLGGGGSGTGDGTGPGSVQGVMTVIDAAPVRCALRLTGAGITVDGKAMTREEAITACKSTTGADIVVTGDARTGDWEELQKALQEASVPWVEHKTGGGAGSDAGSAAPDAGAPAIDAGVEVSPDATESTDAAAPPATP